MVAALAEAAGSRPTRRVKQYLKEGLAAGRWTPGELMPSEAELVAEFGVSRMTVNRALRELQAEGLVDRVAGRRHLRRAAVPPVVDPDDPRPARGDRGARPSPPCRGAPEARGAGAARARRAARPGDRRAGVPFADRPPRQRRAAAVRRPLRQPGLRARLPEVDFTRTTPTHYLLEVAPLWEAQYAIEASAPTAKEARLLGIEPGDPCLVVVRRTMSRGVPITLARLVHPGRRYQLEGAFSP